MPRIVWIQSLLGFSAGLPFFLRSSTLTAWLATEKVDIKTIGLFALVSLPLNVKFLWAAALDRFRLPFLGARRGWLVVTQVVLCLLLCAIASTPPSRLTALAALALVYAFFAATQDILVDAYRTESLTEETLGRGTSFYVVGYRTAMIVGGGGALFLSYYVPWPLVYYGAAALTLTGIVATLLAPAVPDPPVPKNFRKAQVEPVKEFLTRKGALYGILFLLLYKFGDGALGTLLTPFLLQRGFDSRAVGLSQGGIGIAMTIGGVLLGGLLLEKLHLRRGLLYFGIGQALGNLGYILLALLPPTSGLLYAAICIDNVFNGLGTAAFVACMTALTNRQYSVTQYALLSAVPSVLAHTLGALGGYVVSWIGWAGFFATTSVIGLPALFLIRALPFAEQAKVANTHR